MRTSLYTLFGGTAAVGLLAAVGWGSLASGSLASGSLASGSLASGSLASGSLASGSLGQGSRTGESSRRPETAAPASPVASATSSAAAPRPRSGERVAPSAEEYRTTAFQNPAPYIPPQCYTKTQGDDGSVHNPCFSCHAEPSAPNYVEDADLQLEYSFAEPARKNHWTNSWVDRRAAIAAVADAAILSYVRTDNLFGSGGENLLTHRLTVPEPAWDVNGDGKWGGYVPDASFRFDDEGFDRDASGRLTGWRAYAYYPFPGTFWPTNGSAGDVLIRLPASFRSREDGTFDLSIYRINLAIVEALARRANVPIEPTNEEALGVDLDKDGRLGRATKVVYDWAPLSGHRMSYVGQARLELERQPLQLAAGLLPRGTELLHTVRYLDVDASGRVRMASRLKELRYARKVGWRTYSQLENLAFTEAKEKHDFPDRLRTILGDAERGVFNSQGWVYQGFIEDGLGDLRPQTLEETAFCVGCHGGVSATSDGIFSFVRKLPPPAKQDGWYHWTQQAREGSGLEGIPEPKRTDGAYLYATYLEQNGAGDELRENEEVIAGFFEGAALRQDRISALHRDISLLLVPSAARALALNKAYRAVVLEQSYVRGRDAVLRPARNVHASVVEEQSTSVPRPFPPNR